PLPQEGTVSGDPDAYGSPFRKETEKASPGYYAVTLDRGQIRVELTATVHAAHHRYTYPAGAAPKLLFDFGHHLDGGAVSGVQVTLRPDGTGLSGRLHSTGGMSGGFGGYDVFFAMRWNRRSSSADDRVASEKV